MRTLALILLSSVAAAAPDPKLLEKGRALETKGKHAEAIAAYEEYLKAAPDDVVANAELGFAALQAKDLAKAEAATNKAIAKAPPPGYPHDPAAKPRGAALYNLGLIQEAQGKPKDAAASYRASLAARSSRTVREKLQKLDPKIAATADPLAPVKLAGPFKDLEQLCIAWLSSNKESPDQTWGEGGSCKKPDPIHIGGGRLAKPFEAVQAFQLESRENLEIAVKLADGWYHFEYAGGPDRSAAHCGGTDFTIKQLPIASAPPQLTLAYTSKNNGCDHGGNGHGRTWGWDENGTIAIGIGPSGKPSASPVLPQTDAEWWQEDENPKESTKTTLKYTWGKDGALDITGSFKSGGIGDAGAFDPDDLLGHHIVIYP